MNEILQPAESVTAGTAMLANVIKYFIYLFHLYFTFILKNIKQKEFQNEILSAFQLVNIMLDILNKIDKNSKIFINWAIFRIFYTNFKR